MFYQSAAMLAGGFILRKRKSAKPKLECRHWGESFAENAWIVDSRHPAGLRTFEPLPEGAV
jgi:hypothetical protein